MIHDVFFREWNLPPYQCCRDSVSSCLEQPMACSTSAKAGMLNNYIAISVYVEFRATQLISRKIFSDFAIVWPQEKNPG